MLKHPDYPRGNIYLSGGMQFAKDLGMGWRATFSNVLKHRGYFPIDISKMDVAYSKKYGQLYFAGEVEKHLEYKSNIRRHFIYADIELVKNDSDAVVVYYDESVRRGAGTTSEVHTAYENDIPVFLVSAFEDWAHNVPGWMQAETTKIFTSFVELENYLESLPWGILKRDAYGNHCAHSQYLCSLCGSVFEKSKHHFVSKVSPLYCKSCVDLITQTHEGHMDRYEFILGELEKE